MTTIAALADGHTVWMAADTLTNVYERPVFGAARKIRRISLAGEAECLIAASGEGGFADMVTRHLKLDGIPGQDDADDWAASVAEAITDLGVERGFTEQGRLAGSLLLGWGGRLWTVVHAQAIAIPAGIAALGSGEGIAMGAMGHARDTGCSDDAFTVRSAVRIACRYDKHTAEPIHVQGLTEAQATGSAAA